MATEFLERYASESQDVLAAILNQSRDCIQLIDPAGEIEYSNANGLAAFAISSADHILGRLWCDLWPDDQTRIVETALARARRGQSARFQAYRPGAGEQPVWWDVLVSPVHAPDGEIRHILATSRETTGLVNSRLHDRLRREEAEIAAAFERDVAREMRHRLKNQLAVVGAVAKLLARHTSSARELAATPEEKLFSLARAQDLLTMHRENPIRAAEAIAQVLEASGAGDRIEVLTIPSTDLLDESVQTMALILGELQTNALKYGALRNDAGRVQISGFLRDRMLTLRWIEDCGEEIQKPDQPGGGFKLIERLGGSGSGDAPAISWSRRGIVVEFNLRRAD